MRVCLLCGGFGGARFAPGLVSAVGAPDTVVITNPGDDIRFMGLEVWPDFDATLYALAGEFDEALGWGRRGDTFRVADALGDAGWFRIGDADRSICAARTAWLDDGIARSFVARLLREGLGVETTVVPASAQPHRTVVETRGGELPLQEWLVRHRAADTPLRIRTSPVAAAATPEALRGLAQADLVILGPSSPVMSLMPILSVPGMLAAVSRAARVVAISPTVSTVTPRLAPEQGRYRVREVLLEMLGLPHTAAAVPALWPGMLDGIVVDYRDERIAREIEATYGLPVLRADLLPAPGPRRAALAAEVVAFGAGLAGRDPIGVQEPDLRPGHALGAERLLAQPAG